MAASGGYNGTTKPNGSIAGAKGAGGSTGNQTKPNSAPKGRQGTYKSHYGPGELKDQQQAPSKGKTGPNMVVDAPIDSTGTYEDHNGPGLTDQQNTPGGKGGNKGKKKGGITSIKQLRELANKKGAM